MEHKIKIYPVGSADFMLVKLANGLTIIYDCQLLSGDKCYDVKSDLLKELSRDSEGRPYVDLFVNTHPHDDHCKGFNDIFFHGAPSEYDKNKDKDKIIIGELWLTSVGYSRNLASSAKEVRSEAQRRRKLYNDENYKGEYGNYLRIIGYDEDKVYDSRFWYTAGTSVKTANGKTLGMLDIFIHAPFKDDVADAKEENDKNLTSIVTHLAFKINNQIVCKALFGGDAEHEVWEHIIENNQDDSNLEWDLFVAPHHCSWTFFNETNNKEEVKESAIEIMGRQADNVSHVVSSSNEIVKDNQNPPPSHEARDKYKELLDNKNNFFCTATDYIDKNGVPQPIVYTIDTHGKCKTKTVKTATEGYIHQNAPRAGLD